MAAVNVNPLTATASELQTRLADNSITSRQLVKIYLDQICHYNGYLKAVIATAPEDLLDKTAAALDQERIQGYVRGPLHGIPILVKDNIATGPALGLPTTCGSLALQGSKPRHNAGIIDQLQAAGAIILGKANLSEWAWYRSDFADSGWSAVGGQTQSAYVRGGFDRNNDSNGGHSIRKNNTELVNYEKDQDAGRSTAAPPVFPAHIDHTIEGGPKRMLRHLTEKEALQYMNDQYRACIINVWRPLNNPVKDCPLAICDPRSIDTKDLLAADRVTPDFAVELYYLKHNANQKWYWLSNQTLDEIILFVNYDSNCRLEGSDWKTCPHAAFINPDVPADSPPRESIEVRLIVFTRSE
ncbi:hypothetical protein HYE68_010931 [Fusarium pseudograminearum]|nr:hypothetical protein HYE68_010931 [Fusarium pseudograminearum]